MHIPLEKDNKCKLSWNTDKGQGVHVKQNRKNQGDVHNDFGEHASQDEIKDWKEYCNRSNQKK